MQNMHGFKYLGLGWGNRLEYTDVIWKETSAKYARVDQFF